MHFWFFVNQVFGSSSQLLTTAECEVIKSLCTVQTTKQCSAVVVSWEAPSNIWLTAAKYAFVGQALNFRVHMFLKSVVTQNCTANSYLLPNTPPETKGSKKSLMSIAVRHWPESITKEIQVINGIFIQNLSEINRACFPGCPWRQFLWVLDQVMGYEWTNRQCGQEDVWQGCGGLC